MTTDVRADRILVVDDDDAGRYLKTHTLRRHGYTVTEAACGEDALRMVRAELPDLVLLDVKLPDISGLEICRRIKAMPLNVTVLQTSAAFVGSRDRTAALQGGADSYLIEPIEAEELAAMVRALLRMRSAETALRALNQILEEQVAERTSELRETNRRLVAESAHRAEAEEALRHAQKLDAIGQLTGGIAHDFNNLLTVVLGNFEMIERGLDRTPPISTERIRALLAAGRRATEDCEYLTRRLLAFARRDALQEGVIDVNDRIRDFETFLRRSLGEAAVLALALSAGGWTCRLDAGQFEAALLNLTVNARDAMPAGGTLTIATANVEIAAEGAGDMARLYLPEPIAPGEYVRIAIADTGAGMAAEILARAFEPFFTTKDIGKGSGLGLSQVYGFVKQSGGYVAVDTRPGAGTTFLLFLPRCAETAETATTEASGGPVPRGNETVLVVEDNAMVLTVVLEIMTELGYRVLHATTARDALAIIAGEEAVDILFTDIVMPEGMSGIELAREARRRRPDLRVLITSGHSEHGMGDKGEFLSITKPYRRHDLAARLREALAR